MDLLKSIIIAVVEGLTEYLPVSSTAHIIFTQQLIGIEEDNFFKLFALCIQFGAILAVVTLYFRRFFNFKDYYFFIRLAIAVLPALVIGKLLNDSIDAVLEKPIPIAIVLILGGIVLLFVDKYFSNLTTPKKSEISLKNAVIIGFWQCLAMMPGVSRSAASIIGGMQQKLSRETAAEFSFFLAVPTMLAVTVYSLFVKKWESSGEIVKGYELLIQSSDRLIWFIVGNVVAYIVSIIAIKTFIGCIKKYGFKPWGYYRIVAGTAFLVYILWV